MCKTLATLALASVSLLLGSCAEPQAVNTAANKPANTVANTASTASADHSDEVKKIMGELAAALARNDPAATEKFYSEDYHLVTPQGTDQTRSTRMGDMRAGATKFDSFAYENISVRSYGDTAVAIADVKATGMAAGQKISPAIKATLVFHKMKDGWKVVSGQATPITAAAATPDAAAPSSGSNTNANASN